VVKHKQTPIHVWFKQATEAERHRMVELVGVTYNYCRSVCYNHRKAAWSILLRMAHVARIIREEGDEEVQKRLPDVQRGDISGICAECPFYQACKKAGIREGSK
jgi:hypothetical protein